MKFLTFADLSSVQIDYPWDNNVQYNCYAENYVGGLSAIFVPGFSNNADAVINQSNFLLLTDLKQLSSICTVSDPTDSTVYPYRVFTTIAPYNSANSYFLDDYQTTSTSSCSGKIFALGTEQQASNDERCIFELEFLSSNTLRIYRYRTNTATGLKERFAGYFNNYSLTFDSTKISHPASSYIFTYILDERISAIKLCQLHGTGLAYLAVANNNIVKFLYYSIDDSRTVLKINYSKPKSSLLPLETRFYGYNRNANISNLLVDEDLTVSNLYNNYLFSSPTNFNFSTVSANFQPLKNQLNLNYEQNRTNFYEGSDIQHREYTKLTSGIDQNLGLDTIYLTYSIGTKPFALPSNKVTYFHYPFSTVPFNVLNINDAKLPQCGAVAGKTPWTSDKCFKKQEPTVQNIPVFGENTGKWLCSWLYASSREATPIWLDRYYNPNIVNYVNALQMPAQFVNEVTDPYVPYNIIIDKASELTFENGALYAYHHFGKADALKALEAYGQYVVYTGRDVNVYNNNNILPTVYDENGSAVIDTGINNYGITNSSTISGNFTASFWLSAQEYNSPKGNLLLGNFNSKSGYGLFDNELLTFTINLPTSGSELYIFNNELELIQVAAPSFQDIDESIINICQVGEYTQKLFVTNKNRIYKSTRSYNVQKIFDTGLLSSNLIIDSEIFTADVSENYIFAGLLNPNSVNTYNQFFYKIDLSSLDTQLLTYLTDLSANQLLQFCTLTGDTVQSEFYSLQTKCVSASNNFYLDSHNRYWAVKPVGLYAPDNELTKLEHYVTGVGGLSGTTTVLLSSASGTNIIEGFNIDLDDNVWILHSQNKLTKIDSDRKVIFTKTLSAPEGTVSRYLDFTVEIKDRALCQFPVVYYQTVSGGDVLCKYTSGAELTKLVTLDTNLRGNLKSFKTITGYDNRRRFYNNTKDKYKLKVGLQTTIQFSPFDSHQVFTAYLDKSLFAPTWNHIAVSVNNNLGRIDTYLNNILVDTQAFDCFKFKNALPFESNTFLGTDIAYKNIPYSVYLKSLDGISKDITFKDLIGYNYALDSDAVCMLFFEYQKEKTLQWDIPVGKRDYIETMQQHFKYKLPGQKSAQFDLTLSNLGINDSELVTELKQIIANSINNIIPVHAQNRKLEVS